MNAKKLVRALKTPFTMLLLLAFVVVAGNWALSAATAPVPPRPPDPCVLTDVGLELTPDEVTVRVLNGTETNGLASRYGAILRADGFRVIKRGNAPTNDVATSHLVGFRADSPEVVLLRQAFTGIEVVEDGRADHSVDFVIGKEFNGWADDPVLKLPVTGAVCLPAHNSAADDNA